MHEASSRRWQRGLLWLVILLPFALYAVNLPRFGEIQRNDYWGDFRSLIEGDRLTARPSRWIQARSNEHRIGLPLLLWTANMHLTRGDNRALSLLSLGLLLATFAALWKLLPDSVRGSPAGRLAFGLPLAMLIATPVAAHCWVMGFSGNQWYFANLSAALGIGCLARLQPTGSWRDLAPALLATLPGAFSHSTHLSLWPALLIGALLLPVPRWTATFCAATAAAVGALFAWGYPATHHHPIAAGQAGSLAGFIATYLSLRASTDIGTAQLWGAAGILVFAAAVGVVLARPRARRPTLVPWLLVAVYAGLNAVGTSVGRVHLGPSMALSSRYASLPALFWLGSLATLGLAAWELPAGRRRGLALTAVGLIAASFLGVTTAVGAHIFRRHLKVVERQPLAALAMFWNVNDELTMRSVSLSLWQTRVSRAFFMHRGHIPYDRVNDWPLGQPWPAAPAEADVEPVGRWRTAAGGPPGFLLVSGSVARRSGKPDRILFLDGDAVLRGGGVFVPRADARLPPLLWKRPAGTDWFGYVSTSCSPRVRAWLEITEGDQRRLEPLDSSARVRRLLAARCKKPAVAAAQP